MPESICSYLSFAEQGEASMELKLIVLAGAKQGLEIPLKKEKFLIGRAKECALRAGSEAISRRHCAIVRRDDRYTVRDLGSRNGTYVNDKRITEEVPLNAGDELRVGPLKFNVTARSSTPVMPPLAPATEKARKQPPVKDVADVAERTIQKSGDSATEDDISRWLLNVPDNDIDSALKDTRTLRLEETKTLNRSAALGETVVASDAEAAESAAEQIGETAEEAKDAKAGWSLFKRGGKPAAPKKKPGKLPPRPEQPSKNTGQAAADILREMTRRR
jgi:pSer/pThr/pTyr-binding forkhead associated (FHA) protein